MMWILIFLIGLVVVIIFSAFSDYLKLLVYLKIARVTSKISGHFTKRAYRLMNDRNLKVQNSQKPKS